MKTFLVHWEKILFNTQTLKIMEEDITYKTKDLLQDYEQWLKGFRFMTEEKIATYMEFVKLFVRDSIDFLFAENLIDSLASIARLRQDNLASAQIW